MRSAIRRKYTVPVLAVVALLMFGFGFALVPLYDLMCDAFGINGKTDGVAVTYDPSQVAIDTSRSIELRMLVVNNDSMPWRMSSNVNSVKVHPGQVYQMGYDIFNPTPDTMTARAIPSVSPGIAANYLKKIQCFCFNSMSLDSMEQTEGNVVFYIDPEVPDSVNSMVLSYTLFDVTGVISTN